MITEILTVTRERLSSYNCITTLKDSNNKVVAILTGYKQPTKRQKKIIIRNKVYNLNFLN